MEYLFNKNINAWLRESEPIEYVPCQDGFAIQRGSLLGSGFQPVHLNGITLPEEIDGVPVTELTGIFHQGEIGYIEATKLKRINIRISVDSKFGEPGFCQFPLLCGGLQKTIESIKVCFIGDKMRICPIKDSSVRKAITEIMFKGTVLDNQDWDYGSFSPSIFQHCSQLRAIKGSFYGHSMMGRTFEGCSLLKEMPELYVKQMGSREFMGCSSLNRVHLHNGLTRMGSECFLSCQSLEDIYIPDSVDHFGSGIFDGCSRLKTIHLPNHLQEIPDRMFAGCGQLQKVYLSDDLKTIGDKAFAGCTSLNRPWFPDHLTSIGEGAFSGCASIKEVYLPESLETIGKEAFINCGNLIIFGKPGSSAEKYAKENGFQFIMKA